MISPDGEHLYVVFSTNGDITAPPGAVVIYDRDTATGGLTFVQNMLVDQSCAGATGRMLPGSAAISPDGAHLYVTELDLFDSAQRLAGAVTVYRRSPATGLLTFVESHCNGEETVNGLAGATKIVTSPDGASVYVSTEGGGLFDGKVVVFRRDDSSGRLTFVEAKGNGQDGVDGLGTIFAITVSPDSARVYVSSHLPFNSGAVVAFGRNGDSLTFLEAEFDNVAGVQGLAFADDVTLSPDGAHVYVIGSTQNSFGTTILFDAVN